MAFKKLKDYNEQRFQNLFLLRNDGDYADVVFLYEGEDDVMVVDAHYIKSADGSGYVQCLGRGCPACEKNIRVQNKLFIPLYNINEDSVQFWDRNTRFEQVLMDRVFRVVDRPCDYVFRITRHGAAGSIDTTYEIKAKAVNDQYPMSSILADKKIALPDHYNSICRDVTREDLASMLSSDAPRDSAETADLPNYSVTPRRHSDAPKAPEVPIPDPPVPSAITPVIVYSPDEESPVF